MDTQPIPPATSSYTDEGHVYRLVIDPGGPYGWDVRVERDEKVVWKTHYTDWHRVERARWIFTSRSTATRH
jgi:hypothetical protein